MNNIINSFTSFGLIKPQEDGKLYPCTINYYSLMDCTPNNLLATYTIIDHSDDEDYLDSHDDDEAIEIIIPSRLAAYQLIKDLNKQINREISSYATPIGNIPPSAPLDDATNDIYLATDLIYLIMHWDVDNN